MPENAAPLVSVAIPLYRSRPFVDCIMRNLGSIDYPNVEIVISDRHQDDDALDVLAERCAGDTRVRLVRRRDGVGWVQHYNALLAAAAGEYFLWMPHDDSYPPGYIAGLVGCLEEQPRVILAFGRVEVADERGRIIYSDDRLDPSSPHGEPWTARSALEMLMFRSLWLPQFHGVFRREPVVRAGLYVRPTTGDVEADLYWVFAMGLLGELRRVPSVSYLKRLHGTNASILWGARTMRHVLDGFVVPGAYLRDFAPRAGDARRAIPALAVWAALRSVGRLTRAWSRPSKATRDRARRALRRLLS